MREQYSRGSRRKRHRIFQEFTAFGTQLSSSSSGINACSISLHPNLKGYQTVPTRGEVNQTACSKDQTGLVPSLQAVPSWHNGFYVYCRRKLPSSAPYFFRRDEILTTSRLQLRRRANDSVQARFRNGRNDHKFAIRHGQAAVPPPIHLSNIVPSVLA